MNYNNNFYGNQNNPQNNIYGRQGQAQNIYQQMNMISHKAICKDLITALQFTFFQNLHEFQIILFIF